jgi:hypothetical protein
MPYQLIASPISRDTVDACRDLLAAAEDGLIVGFAVVALLKRQRFMVDACGEAERNPVLMRGALLDLDECLKEMARNKRDSHTTR